MTDGEKYIGYAHSLNSKLSHISMLVGDKGVMSYRDISIDDVELDNDKLPMIKRSETSSMPSGIESLLVK